MKRPTIIAAVALLAACSPTGNGEREAVEAGGVTFRTMTVERMPGLLTARGCHRTVLLGDEIPVFGGHTDGFKPVQTAEYFSGGAWHELQMMYTHDNGAAVQLPDGRIMLLGGTPEDFGIGQSWGVETYDPHTRTFSSDCILDRKRARPAALALEDGGVLVCGNWYAPDGLEIYREGRGFSPLPAPSVGRAEPFILPASEKETAIFACEGTRGEILDGTVDVLGGEPYHEPLLDRWAVIPNHALSPENFRIAPYTYLLTARDRETGSFAVIKFTEDKFSLLDVDAPLPSEGLEGEIFWSGRLQVNRPDRTAWVQGADAGGNIYLARIDYDAVLEGGTASVSFLCAEIPGDKHFVEEALMLPGNRFAMVGGVEVTNAEGQPQVTNFSTTSLAYILHTEAPEAAPVPWATAAAVGLAVLLALILLAVLLLRRKENEGGGTPAPEEPAYRGDLMSRIISLMEEKELFRRSDLKLADIASELGTNVTYISACINGQAGVSFNEFVTRYRVKYAQALMKQHPGMKVSQISEEAGFSGERSFFRNFKKVTGVTPRQWVESSKD